MSYRRRYSPNFNSTTSSSLIKGPSSIYTTTSSVLGGGSYLRDSVSSLRTGSSLSPRRYPRTSLSTSAAFRCYYGQGVDGITTKLTLRDCPYGTFKCKNSTLCMNLIHLCGDLYSNVGHRTLSLNLLYLEISMYLTSNPFHRKIRC